MVMVLTQLPGWISSQLVDTTTGGHLWAERYDRDLKDIFILQDEITQQIVSDLGVKFEQIEQERALRKDTANLNACEGLSRTG